MASPTLFTSRSFKPPSVPDVLKQPFRGDGLAEKNRPGSWRAEFVKLVNKVPKCPHVSGIPETWKSRVLLNGKPLPTRFVSKNELEATISPEAIAKAGT